MCAAHCNVARSTHGCLHNCSVQGVMDLIAPHFQLFPDMWAAVRREAAAPRLRHVKMAEQLDGRIVFTSKSASTPEAGAGRVSVDRVPQAAGDPSSSRAEGKHGPLAQPRPGGS
eukprot:CAMPEP_0168454012 /NCGR_PEP_ID=MMETSP0228-20121227/49990_1 /TAXON_ID=133427 /ORGANISM="Protoceratium reticulatum, Strain CCCM 535 (=CCMP 1889)" /LENGTH=113 /DNA_ID=CAMNT_0008468763 /DNA_START=125 /DNA_END=464 /DNA_ORIENTATION=+